MIYIQIALAMILYGAGYLSAWKIDSLKIARLEISIESANDLSKSTLKEAQASVSAAEQQALISSDNFDKERIKNDELNNNFATTFKSMRLRDPHAIGCRKNTLPKSNSPVPIKDYPESGELSEDLTKLLRSESFRADQMMSYANECYEFVKNNCGVK
ncbi:MAG: hypothetical protein RIR39_1546 [Pseudomonadota bacterium]|jgi:hypothetical protein